MTKEPSKTFISSKNRFILNMTRNPFENLHKTHITPLLIDLSGFLPRLTRSDYCDRSMVAVLSVNQTSD